MESIRPGLSSALPAPRELKDVSVGESGELTRHFGRREVEAFGELIGDLNPIHFDETYARTTTFGKCIVHGPLYSGLIGTVLGTVCPGPGTLLLRSDYRFLRPVFVGEDVTASVAVSEIDEKGAVHLNVKCVNQDGVTVLSGTAITRIAR